MPAAAALDRNTFPMAPSEVLMGKQLEAQRRCDTQEVTDAKPATSAAPPDSRETEGPGMCPREKVSMEGGHLGFCSRHMAW